MKNELIDEIIACLPHERTVFRYFKGQYAYLLLSYAAQRYKHVREIKQSAYQRLLNHPEIKTLLSLSGKGTISPDTFDYSWKNTSESFVLTLDRWGSANRYIDQVTRPGSNLVLQLNFSEKHNRAYQKMVKPIDEFVFNYNGHPVMAKNKRHFFRDTLAWSRLDIDFEKGEVLIEEIQSDWVRRVKTCLTAIKSGKPHYFLNICDCEPKQFIAYVENVLAPMLVIWSEAMLMATISFIYTELGIRKIFYHTYETGSRLKQITGKPPRSIYSDLPRKFCFELTDEAPVFLQQDKYFKRTQRKMKKINWYQLEL